MKLNKFFMGVLGTLALSACSSDDPVNTGVETPDNGKSDNYVSISIEMPTAIGGGRAANTNDSDNFDEGTANESEVSNVVFFFFDAAGNQIEIQKIDSPKFEKKQNWQNENPYITSMGTVEVQLNGDPSSYKKVAVAVNSTASDATELYAIHTVADLMAWGKDDYVGNDILKAGESEGDFGKNQVMSNSVYYNTDNYSTAPTADKKVTLVDITDANIYTSAQKAAAGFVTPYVEIYVERVAARIDVTKAEFDMSKYYIYKEEDKTEVKTITLYDYETGEPVENVYVRPFVKGMCLNVLTTSSKLIKPITYNVVGYTRGNGDYKNFKWNDPLNKRSYWATTAVVGMSDMQYFSWKQANDQGPDAFKQYVNPNTQDYLPTNNDGIYANDGSSNNTKIMITAELYQVDADGNKIANKEGEIKPLDLVRYGGDYMLPKSLLYHAANIVNGTINNYNWAGLKVGDNTLDADKVNDVKVVVSNGLSGINAADFIIDIMDNDNGINAPDETDWIAAVKAKTGGVDFELPKSVTVKAESDGSDILVTLEDDVYNAVKAQISAIITDAIAAVNNPTILYWKNGQTYYYHTIRHQGFYGLTGTSTDDDATDFLFGVVRNHIYQISLDGIFGLGTPVIDPNKPINPDRPDNNPSYISARINILPWRVVKNSATIH